jgi:maltoporin
VTSSPAPFSVHCTKTSRALLLTLCSMMITHSPVWSQESEQTPPSKPLPTSSKSAHTPFWFGSYGRVGLSTDDQGGEGQKRQVTPYAPRLIEDNYLELDLGYKAYRGRHGQVDVVTTISAFDQLFHYNGSADAQLALRRMYAEVRHVGGTQVWTSLGSRWLRGNDIYLMNFWPLDDLNTLGLTLGHSGKRHEAWIHAGVSRLNHRSQTQYVDVPSANNFGAESVLMLNRQRLIIASLYERRYSLGKRGGWKWKLYTEYHALPSGEETLEGSFTDQRTLPDDAGLIAGLQLGMWGVGHPSDHLNLWARYGRGLAIYDELGSPSAVNRDKRSWDAEEWRLALAGNWGLSTAHGLSVQWGSYIRHYRDADELSVDYDDRVEGSVVVRPQLNLNGFFTPAVEASAQWSQAGGNHPVTLSTQAAQVYQLALIPAISFSRGAHLDAYTRPQLRLIYAVSFLNDAALSRYPERDPRSQGEVAHYLGARAEWWFGRGGGY